MKLKPENLRNMKGKAKLLPSSPSQQHKTQHLPQIYQRVKILG